MPVLVVYGERDWSRPDEWRRTVAAIPNAKMETIPEGGHFLSLDQPKRLAEPIAAFAKTCVSRRATKQSLAQYTRFPSYGPIIAVVE